MEKEKVERINISFIIPVYNRPREVEELLESMVQQTEQGFEVVIVEDGSGVSSEAICKKYQNQLNLSYFFKNNSGPGLSRNYGSERASGDYLIFLDSDCILPPDYFKIVYRTLKEHYIDAFGGPDNAHADFSVLQKAINYSMTSFLTTGGIRGVNERLEKFHPRSFNMGYSKDVFQKTKGFSPMRFGEDIDMSIRIIECGFKTRLIKEAFVYHKRRTSLKQFFKQVFNSGIARINLYKRHPQSLKMVHAAPALFTIGCVALVFLSIFCSVLFLIPIGIHVLLLFFDSSIKNKSLLIGSVSVITSYIQLFGYGTGFITAVWKRLILNKKEFAAYTETFYD
jgi:glycosyltransferase involved in cell wall biosynthesis